MHANIVFDGDNPASSIHKRVRKCVYACVSRAHVGVATETKFDCTEAKGLFYTMQTNHTQREINWMRELHLLFSRIIVRKYEVFAICYPTCYKDIYITCNNNYLYKNIINCYIRKIIFSVSKSFVIIIDVFLSISTFGIINQSLGNRSIAMFQKNLHHVILRSIKFSKTLRNHEIKYKKRLKI